MVYGTEYAAAGGQKRRRQTFSYEKGKDPNRTIRGKTPLNVESGGKTYPTTNPGFVPNPNVTKEIDFDQPNGRVKVTAGGKSFDLSKEEYTGQFVTPNTMALDQTLADQQTQRELTNSNKPTSPENQALANTVGQTEVPKTAEQSSTQPSDNQGITFLGNLGEAAKGATGDALTYGAAGAAGGAVVGSLAAGAGAVPGALIGGLGGAASGLIKGLYSGLKEEYNKDVRVEYANYQSSLKNLKASIDNINKGGDKLESVDVFNNELAKIDREERRLKALNEHDWLSNGRVQLVKIQAFNEGQRQRYITAMQLALLKPNPNEQFTIGEEGVLVA